MKWFQVKDANLEEVKKGSKWTNLPTDEVLQKTVKALIGNGFDTQVVKTAEEAKKKVIELIPQGAEVMTMTSQTLDAIGVSSLINESGEYDAVRPKLMAMDRQKDSQKMQKLGSAPDWVVGSVHAITEDGSVVIASNSGSQLAAYAYGSSHVVWVVSTAKIVENLDEAKERVYKHSLPLESERANKAYAVPGSFVSKTLIMNQEPSQGRIKLILVQEKLGF